MDSCLKRRLYGHHVVYLARSLRYSVENIGVECL
jgi:hypothetical protein